MKENLLLLKDLSEPYITYHRKMKMKRVSDFKGKKVVGAFCEKELQKTNKKEFRIEKVIKRKGDKLYVKWKGCNSSFNSLIDKKDIVNE